MVRASSAGFTHGADLLAVAYLLSNGAARLERAGLVRTALRPRVSGNLR